MKKRLKLIDIKNKILNVDHDEKCWIWTGCISDRGYGYAGYNGKSYRIHRLIYELYQGCIPEGFELDHLCRNRSCCNPKHLEIVTHKVNTLRGSGFSAINARKTHCIHGHEFTKENTYIQKLKTGYRRHCKRCNRIRKIKTRHENKTRV